MVIFVEDVFFRNMVFSELQIALAEVAFARSGVVLAELVSVFLSVLVSHELSDAGVSVGGACTFLAIFVLFAHCIKRIDCGQGHNYC
jgi:hypothetical protein